jgi:hypothetical protein
MRRKWIAIAVLCAMMAVGIELFLMTQFWQKEQGSVAYLLTQSCEAGTVINQPLLRKISVYDKSAKTLKILKLEDLIGKTLNNPIAGGKILVESDFDKKNESRPIQTMVLKLNLEQSHKGELAVGEKINLLSYRQGASELIEDITIKEVTLENSLNDRSDFLITVEGSPEKLKALFLAQQEGILLIVKKTAVQIP